MQQQQFEVTIEGLQFTKSKKTIKKIERVRKQIQQIQFESQVKLNAFQVIIRKFSLQMFLFKLAPFYLRTRIPPLASVLKTSEAS